jgi:hypothetical protein
VLGAEARSQARYAPTFVACFPAALSLLIGHALHMYARYAGVIWLRSATRKSQ